MADKKAVKTVAILVAIILAAAIVYSLLTMPDNRNAAEHIGDAIHDLPQGIDKAGRQLEDRTPGQRLGDSIKDATKPPRDGE